MIQGTPERLKKLKARLKDADAALKVAHEAVDEAGAGGHLNDDQVLTLEAAVAELAKVAVDAERTAHGTGERDLLEADELKKAEAASAKGAKAPAKKAKKK